MSFTLRASEPSKSHSLLLAKSYGKTLTKIMPTPASALRSPPLRSVCPLTPSCAPLRDLPVRRISIFQTITGPRTEGRASPRRNHRHRRFSDYPPSTSSHLCENKKDPWWDSQPLGLVASLSRKVPLRESRCAYELVPHLPRQVVVQKSSLFLFP